MDSVGLDYLRTGGRSGYELTQAYIDKFRLSLPGRKTFYSKAVWIMNEKAVRKTPWVVETWRWYRAHLLYTYLSEAIHHPDVKKPVFIFNLSWEAGHHHGQDPVMAYDAGVARDAIMLYESSRPQFNFMVNYWKKYLKLAPVMVGDSIHPINLKTSEGNPVQEYYDRLSLAIKNLLPTGRLSGIFFHDISRAFRYYQNTINPHEWFVAVGSLFTEYRAISDKPAVRLLDFKIELKPGSVVLRGKVGNSGKKKVEVLLQGVPLGHVRYKHSVKLIIRGGKTNSFKIVGEPRSGLKKMYAIRMEGPGKPQFGFEYRVVPRPEFKNASR